MQLRFTCYVFLLAILEAAKPAMPIPMRSTVDGSGIIGGLIESIWSGNVIGTGAVAETGSGPSLAKSIVSCTSYQAGPPTGSSLKSRI